MSTFKATVLEHHKKQDNTWNVKVRLTHKRVTRYLDIPIFLVKGQMNRKFEIKDDYAIDQVNEILKSYREAVGLGISAKMVSRSAFKLSPHFTLK